MSDSEPTTDSGDSFWGVVLSGVFIFGAACLMLYCNYKTWSPPQDLVTASAVATAYFVAHLGKMGYRSIRDNRQAKARETQETKETN